LIGKTRNLHLGDAEKQTREIAVIADMRVIGKAYRGGAEKCKTKAVFITASIAFGSAKKSVLREGTTIYRYFVTMDGVVQCPRHLPMKT
jgi:hypothetical protein